MRYLFIIQGEGRGHLTQAISLRQQLEGAGHEVVAFMVGKSPLRRVPDFFLRQCGCAEVLPFESPNFLPQAAGKRTALPLSVAYNLLRLPKYLRSIRFIRQTIARTQPDVVVNFYELLAGLSYLLCPPSVPMVCIAHQYTFLHPLYTFPPLSQWRWWERPQAAAELAALRFFTRLTCAGASRTLALSLRPMPQHRDIVVVPPLLRREVLALTPTRGNYLHGYMLNSSLSTQVEQWHTLHPDVPLHFFWDKREADPVTTIDDNLHFHRLDDISFLRYMASCRAYATTAGFESVCEALFLGKPLLLVPTHIEQACNAYDTLHLLQEVQGIPQDGSASRAAGISASSFDLDRLAAISSQEADNASFRHWVRHAEYAFVPLLTGPFHLPSTPSNARQRIAYGMRHALHTAGNYALNLAHKHG